MLLTELNSKVLLDIYGWLGLTDSINLAGTCVRLRDVAELHYTRYKIFNLNNFLKDPERAALHNCIDAKTVLKCIGPFISVLVADLDEANIGDDLGKSIRKYCCNVKSLQIIDRRKSSNPYAKYTEWLKCLELKKISLPFRVLLLVDLFGTTSLEKLDVYLPLSYYDENVPCALPNILQSNLNISSLRIPLDCVLDFDIFAKLKSLKRVGLLEVEMGSLGKVTAKLKMTNLEKVEIDFYVYEYMEWKLLKELNAFLTTLAGNAPQLNELSLDLDMGEYLPLDDNPLPSLHLLNLTALRLNVAYPNLQNELGKMQPHLKHLDLFIHNFDDDHPMGNVKVPSDPTQQIISLIKNLEEMEVFHIRLSDEYMNLSVVCQELREERVTKRIWSACSTNRSRPTLRLYLMHRDWNHYVLQVKVRV